MLDLDDLEVCGFGSVSVEMGCNSCWLLGFLTLIWSAIVAGVLLLLLLSAKTGMISVLRLLERRRGGRQVNCGNGMPQVNRNFWYIERGGKERVDLC